MTTIQFSFGESPVIVVTIQETNATKAVEQLTEFTKVWLESQKNNTCEECEAVLNLPKADFSGEQN